MALKYKMYKSTRNDSTANKWYARAVHEDTIDLNGLASIMQANCTVKESDILAVLRELVETMTRELQSSKRVKIDGFGTFKIGLTSKGAATASDFKSSTNIIGTHILFQPEVSIDAQRKRTYKLLSGVKVSEASIYDVDKSDGVNTQADTQAESQAEDKAVGE